MDTKVKAFNDSASHVSNPPPSYDASVSADSVGCKRSLFSFLQFKKKRAALSRIREIVSYSDFNPSSVESIVNSCAATLSAGEFSDLVQKLNIDGHTALYWAIVNNRRDALWVFYKFITEFSPACTSDLRRACMTVNDHDLFMQLNLGHTVDIKDKSLRRLLGFPRDKIDVFQHGFPESMMGSCPLGDIAVHKLGENYFFAGIAFRMFQTRLRTTLNVAAEFIARGRIWMLEFYLGSDGKWHIVYSLSGHSLPVHPDSILSIMSHRARPGSDTPEHLHLDLRYPSHTLLPKGSSHPYTEIKSDKSTVAVSKQLDDWPMDNDTEYVDSDGTLWVGLTMKLT